MAANRRFVQKLIQANNKLNSAWVTFVRTPNRLKSYVGTFHKGPIMRKVFTSHDFITNMTLLNVCNVHQRNILLVTPWENSNLILMDSTFYCHLVCKPRLLFIHHSVTFYNIDYKVWVIDDDIQFFTIVNWLQYTCGLFTNMVWLQFHRGSVIKSFVKCGMKLLIHSQTLTVQPWRVENG